MWAKKSGRKRISESGQRVNQSFRKAKVRQRGEGMRGEDTDPKAFFAFALGFRASA